MNSQLTQKQIDIAKCNAYIESLREEIRDAKHLLMQMEKERTRLLNLKD